jgi:histidyl-tRNA synthetase
MGEIVRTVKGTRDLLPPETSVWRAVEKTARRIFRLYGYREIRTPVLESTDLFVRSVGAGTDIVGKEMYSFPDRKGRSLSLRPESTASVVRAFVQHRFMHRPLPAKLYYFGPHFRYERPQKGRYRQFHQIGAEMIGDPGPHSDAELLAMLVRFLEELEFSSLTVLLNTVGDEASRSAYRDRLVEFLLPHRERLSAESRRRLERNPLRILDSKDPEEKKLLATGPQLEECLTEASGRHFEGVREALERQGISYRLEPALVRGLDYYSRTVFEIVSESLGAQNAIVGGGRYDQLVAELGGPELPAIGFAIGEDRLIEVLPSSFRANVEERPPILVVPIEPVPVAAGMELAEELRLGGLSAITEFGSPSVRSALKRADRGGIRWVMLLGEDEMATQVVSCRDMERGEQTEIPRREVAERMGDLT